jgi:hypothetical protein
VLTGGEFFFFSDFTATDGCQGLFAWHGVASIFVISVPHISLSTL